MNKQQKQLSTSPRTLLVILKGPENPGTWETAVQQRSLKWKKQQLGNRVKEHLVLLNLATFWWGVGGTKEPYLLCCAVVRLCESTEGRRGSRGNRQGLMLWCIGPFTYTEDVPRDTALLQMGLTGDQLCSPALPICSSQSHEALKE